MSTPEPSAAPGPVLEISGVSRNFRRRGGETVAAVRGVSLTVNRGETVALVGESGSGKSTLARIALGLLPPDTGQVKLLGEPLYGIAAARLRRIRTAMQPVFQDSGAAFNPRRTVQQLLAQAVADRSLQGTRLQSHIVSLLERVRLRPGSEFLMRFPHELSGGQRQRLAIARAIAMNPILIVADEPLSGADVSTRGQILNLLLDLRDSSGVAYLFITHDIAIAQAFAHRVAVMYRGEIVEHGDATTVIDSPADPYTRRLVAAIRTLDGPATAAFPPRLRGNGASPSPSRDGTTGPGAESRLRQVAGL